MDDNDEWYAALGTLPEVLGPADLPTLNEGLRYLFKELREAQTAFVGGSYPEGVYLSLVAIYAFVSLFRAVGTEGLTAPLMELESALCALDEGVTEPLLKPARRAKSGRPRATQLRQVFLGTVAYTKLRFGLPAIGDAQGGSGRPEPCGHQAGSRFRSGYASHGTGLVRAGVRRFWTAFTGRAALRCSNGRSTDGGA
jgi:hypothetical protein